MAIDPLLLAAAARGTTTLTTLVEIVATSEKGGDIVRFCLHTRPLTFDGDVYEPVSFTPSKMQMRSGLQPDNATFVHLLKDEFDKRNIKGGKWQGATVRMMLVDYLQPELGYLRRHIGRIGEMKSSGKESETEFRGLISLLSQEIGDKTSRLCRYKLGDANCTKNLTDYTFSGVVDSVINQQRFTATYTTPTMQGLKGDYYGGTNFETLVNSRVDGPIDFDWTSSPRPIKFLGNTNYSVRWTGVIRPQYSEDYYFQVTHDDGAVLKINGVTVIDEWGTTGTHDTPVPVVGMTGGNDYPITLEFYNLDGTSRILLEWRSATSIPSYVTIPSSRLLCGAVMLNSPDYFKYGKVSWKSGANAGLSMETLNNENDEIILFLKMPNAIEVGDEFDIVAGDDKTLVTCHHKFNNAINHGGEDCVPKQDEVLTIPESPTE